MEIILAADHRGFALKEKLKTFIETAGHRVHDSGALSYDANDDYPDFGHPAALMVAATTGSKGILICGSGMGMDVIANKVKGVRATIAYSKQAAEHGASQDGINVITLAADVLSEETAKEIVETFLATSLKPDEKYTRRIQKITTIEEGHF